MKSMLRLASAPLLLVILLFSSCGEDKLAQPSIDSFTPASGKPGTLVTIKGSHFGTGIPDNHVLFNGTLAEIVTAQSNELIVRVPDDATTGKIKVISWQMPVESATDFIVEPPPTITSFTPTSGKFGDQITITGDYFDLIGSRNIVTVGGADVTVISASKTQLIVKLASGGNTGKIAVTVAGKTSTSEGNFTYTKAWIVSPFVGSGVSGSADGTGTTASFNSISSIAIDSNENIFVADELNSLIRKAASNQKVTTVTGKAGEGLKDGSVAEAMFNKPGGIAVDDNGDVYISDSFNQLVRKISNGVVSTLAGDGDEKFNNPRGLCLDSQGNVFVADNLNNAIRKITPTGEVTTFASFHHPWGICIDKDDNIYVTQPNDNKISKINPDGDIEMIVGNAVTSYPIGISVDYHGNIFFIEDFNVNVRIIAPDKTVTTLFNSYIESGLPNPTSLTTNAAGTTVYIADDDTRKIIKYEFK